MFFTSMSKQQLHKRFTADQVKIILQWYCDKAIDLKGARERLEISEQHFFRLLKNYKEHSATFSIQYPHREAHNRLEQKTDDAIRFELEKEKSLIQNHAMPVTQYNYAAVRDELMRAGKKNNSTNHSEPSSRVGICYHKAPAEAP